MAREFIVPGQIITGAGALDMAEAVLGRFGKKAMIVFSINNTIINNMCSISTS